ncbi:MAG: SH3 domain-containing protein [Verrucomicrobiae bacterium]|nr:SH3 domain-containing protein [Verrucomicrobiae bacterium]
MKHSIKKLSRVVITLVLSFACCYADDDADPVVLHAEFDTAVAAYGKGDFASAYRKFTKVADEYLSTELCVNAGSAAYRTGNDGEAALWFRRALVLDSRCMEARQNLRFLKRRLGFLRFDSGGLQRELGDFLSVPVWRFWFALFAGVGAVCLTASLFLRIHRPVRNWLLGGSVGALFLSGVFGIGWLGNAPDREILSLHVVVAPDTAALAAPNSSAGRIVALPPGSEIEFLEQRGSWIYAEIPGGSRGWIRASQVIQLWPYSVRLIE